MIKTVAKRTAELLAAWALFSAFLTFKQLYFYGAPISWIRHYQAQLFASGWYAITFCLVLWVSRRLRRPELMFCTMSWLLLGLSFLFRHWSESNLTYRVGFEMVRDHGALTYYGYLFEVLWSPRLFAALIASLILTMHHFQKSILEGRK